MSIAHKREVGGWDSKENLSLVFSPDMEIVSGASLGTIGYWEVVLAKGTIVEKFPMPMRLTWGMEIWGFWPSEFDSNFLIWVAGCGTLSHSIRFIFQVLCCKTCWTHASGDFGQWAAIC